MATTALRIAAAGPNPRLPDPGNRPIRPARPCPTKASPMPRTTVAIVTWNGRAHLDPLFAGLLSQGAPGGFDVVVVDNASRDGTPEAVEAIATTDARVRVVRSGRNAGFAVGNNLALDHARGDYLVALNSDTVPEPG